MQDAATLIADQVADIRGLIDEVIAGASQPTDDGINDDRLRTLVVGLERVSNASEAAQAAAMVAMGREAMALDAAERAASDRPTRSYEEFVPDELSVLLSCTRTAASLRYGTAWNSARHAALADAWRAGTIDARKVAVIADELQHLDAAAAAELAPAAVEYATRRTPSQTREWLHKRVISIDPGTAEARRRSATEQRRVVITPADDGMSELWAWLPSIDARQIQQTLTRAAQDLGADDARTMDQRRSDALTDLLLGRCTSAPVNLQVIVPADTLTGASDEPAWVPGLGPITGNEARTLVGEPGSAAHVVQSVRLLLTDPSTGTLTDVAEGRYRPSLALERAVRSRDVTCRFPGCRRAASGNPSGTDLDHTVPWPEGPTTASNLAVLCRRHHRLKHSAGWQVTLLPDGTMAWVTPTGRKYQSEPWQYTEPRPASRTPDVPDPPALE